MKVVLASTNRGKIAEIQSVLQGLQIILMLQSECGLKEVEETGLTFVENALIKARAASHETGLPAIADDSGLVVPALNGAPGIYTARYAGTPSSAEKNNQKLLHALKDAEGEQRRATFHCVMVYLAHENDPSPLICDGTWSGVIAKSPRGEQGFGYDPIFFIPALNQTAAELPLATKNKISHRGQALAQLHALLRERS